MSSKIEYEGKKYDFNWRGVVGLLIGGPLFALIIYYSNDYLWLHGITAELTVAGLRLFTRLDFYVKFIPNHRWGTGYFIFVPNAENTGYLSEIMFTTFCTGVQAIAIFVGVITFIPFNIADTNPKAKVDLVKRKIIAAIVCSALFYFVNIARMWLQLWLYHIGYNWEDIHYSISAASSFIAIAAILVMHKWTPEFILSLIWIGDQIRNEIKKSKENPVEFINWCLEKKIFQIMVKSKNHISKDIMELSSNGATNFWKELNKQLLGKQGNFK
jgi:exosortase/archaeosortase family protein